MINGYGPQEDDSLQNSLVFWSGLDQEICCAKSENCLILIQLDANAKVGQSVIAADPNELSDSNGRQLLGFLERHNLKLLNSDIRCEGSVTRYRQTKKVLRHLY